MMSVPDEAVRLFNEGYGTDEIVRRRVLNKEGKPASSRTARRWRQYWKESAHPHDIIYQNLPKIDINSERVPPTRPKAAPRLLDAAIFDLETSDFGTEGYEGHLVACSILPLRSSEPLTLSIKYEDGEDDSRFLADVFAELWKYDVLIAQNGAEFDLNWLNSRRSYYGMPQLRTWLYFDTYQTAKTLGLKTRKSLGNLGDYYGLEGEKTAVQKTSWSKIRSPYRVEFERTMCDIIYHCEQDVILTRNLWDVLFTEALVLAQNQFKTTKWRTGVPSWESWRAEWDRLRCFGRS